MKFTWWTSEISKICSWMSPCGQRGRGTRCSGTGFRVGLRPPWPMVMLHQLSPWPALPHDWAARVPTPAPPHSKKLLSYRREETEQNTAYAGKTFWYNVLQLGVSLDNSGPELEKMCFLLFWGDRRWGPSHLLRKTRKPPSYSPSHLMVYPYDSSLFCSPFSFCKILSVLADVSCVPRN